MRLPTASACCGVVLLTGATAFAATTTHLEGVVLDETGAPLSGVTVEITSEALIGGPQTAVTGPQGGVAFHLLPVGMYAVQATLAGYRPANGEVRLRLDRVGAITLHLAPLEFSGEIEVTSEVPVVSTTQVSTGQVFGRDYLDRNLVSLYDRHYFSVINHAPGVQEFQALGSLESENLNKVDGLDLAITNFPFEAVEEVSVLTGGFDAELGLATGAVVNVVTRSGGNAFSGTVDLRYRDERLNESGDHYDPDNDVSSYRSASAAFGGPLVRDRLWFFVSVRNRVRESSPGFTTATRRFDVLEHMGKLTWAAGPSSRLVATYSADPCNIDNWNAETAWDALPEALAFQDQGGYALQAELQSVLSDDLLLTVAVGTYQWDLDRYPQSGDLDTPSEYDLDQALRFSNFEYAYYSTEDRDHARADLAWLADGPSGRHEIKGGIDVQLLEDSSLDFFTGGSSIYYFNTAARPDWHDGNGDGLIDAFLYRDYPFDVAREPVRSDGEVWSAFLQDAWRPIADLTVRAGVRYDRARWSNQLGATVADLAKWQPRLGVAWDVTGRGQHVLRAGWGRFMHPTSLGIPSFAAGTIRGTAEYYGLDFLCSTQGWCDRDTLRDIFGPDSEFVHVDADGDEHPYYLGFVYGLEPVDTVDTLGVGTLEAPYADSLTLSYEARLLEQTSLGLTWVDKQTRSLLEDTCSNNTWVWGDGEAPSLDDPSTWPDPAGCTGWVVANIPGLERDYRAWILTLESRARPWLYVLASYTHSESRGTTDAQIGWTPARVDYDFYPTNFVNLDGAVSPDRRHVVKLNGSVLLPWQVTLGINGTYASAQALDMRTDCAALLNATPDQIAELGRLGIDYEEAVQYCPSNVGYLFLEPRGSRRGDDWWQVDLQVAKGFTIGKVYLEGIVSVINLFSEEAPDTFVTDPLNPRGWGTPTWYQQPRRWELGLRVEF
jgi:hypothetical protein